MTSVYSNARYTPGQWAHVAVTYNGLYMKLYVNGAQTAVSREQSGDVFSPLTKKCKVSLILITFNSLPTGTRVLLTDFMEFSFIFILRCFSLKLLGRKTDTNKMNVNAKL